MATSSIPVVLKFGGELIEEPQRLAAVARAIAGLQRSRPVPLVIVHGGGREIDASLAKAGIPKRQVDGIRITDEATLEVVVGVLAGLVNTRFVAALGAAGVQAVGLTGADAGVGTVQRAARHISTGGETVDLGYVGEPIGTGTPALLQHLCSRGYVPVISSIGASRDGRLYNVNADTLAAHIAGRLKTPRLVIAGATAGVLDGAGSTIAEMRFADIDALVESGGATAGMVAKLGACRAALHAGAREVFVADGRNLDALEVLVRHGRTAGAARSTGIVPSGAKARSRSVSRKAGVKARPAKRTA